MNRNNVIKKGICICLVLALIFDCNVARAHALDYFGGVYLSGAISNQSALRLRVQPSAQTTLLTSSIYTAAYDWNGISSGVQVSSIVIASEGMPYLNGFYYVYGQTYSDGTLGELVPYGSNGQIVSASSNWQSISIYMNTNPNAYSGSSNATTAAKKTFIHEVGHALKLAHPQNLPSSYGHLYYGYPKAIMNQGFPNGVEVSSSIENHDKQNLKAKWGD